MLVTKIDAATWWLNHYGVFICRDVPRFRIVVATTDRRCCIEVQSTCTNLFINTADIFVAMEVKNSMGNGPLCPEIMQGVRETNP